MRSAGGPAGRIEVVPTQRHWETVYVAAEVPLARGWERQLDMGRNPLLLRRDARSATPITNGCAITPCGSSPWPTCRSTRQPSQRLRWSAAGCRSSNRCGTTTTGSCGASSTLEPLVEGPARLVELGPTSVQLEVIDAEAVLVRVRYSSHWSLDVPGCVEPSPDGWTTIQVERPGSVTLRPVVARSLPLIGRLDDCAT